jgi:hypothetical protein
MLVLPFNEFVVASFGLLVVGDGATGGEELAYLWIDPKGLTGGLGGVCAVVTPPSSESNMEVYTEPLARELVSTLQC